MAIFLNHLALIRVKGQDAFDFLQSQLTNDISKLQQNEIQINAFCQHQGKIKAIVWLFYFEENLCICLPKAIKKSFIKDIMVYRFMSEVAFEDLNEYFIYGHKHVSQKNIYKINESLGLSFEKNILKNSSNSEYWEYLCITNLLPEVTKTNSAKFIPQELNLDIDEFGVSFSKGCYPGQEVVARMHYLGKPKRRLYRFTSKFKPSVGDSIDVKNSKSLKSSGQVIRMVEYDNKFYFLGVLEVSYVNDQIFLNHNQERIVSLMHE